MAPTLHYIKQKYRNLVGDKGFSEILSGTVWALISRVGATAIALLASLMITRLYGAESMGILALVTSVLGIVTVFTVLGTGTSILRLIPEHLTKYSPTSAFHVYRKAQVLVAGASVITGLLLYLFSGDIATLLFNKPHLTGLIAASAVFVAFNSIMLLSQQAVRGLKLIRTYSLLQLLPSLCLLAFLTVGLKWKTPNGPAYAQLLAWAVTGIAGALIMDRAFRRQMRPTDTVRHTSIHELLRISLPMLMTASMNMVIAQTGVIILGMHRPSAEVGYYAVAVKLATLTAFVLGAINTMSAPAFSRLFHEGNTAELFRVARKSTRLIVWTTTPILIGLLAFGMPILHLFRPEFRAAYPAMVILVAGQFIHSVSGSTGLFMNMTGHQKALSRIIAVAAGLNIVINLMLTPRLGIIGTAIAACASTVFWNAAALAFIHRRYGQTIAHWPFA